MHDGRRRTAEGADLAGEALAQTVGADGDNRAIAMAFVPECLDIVVRPAHGNTEHGSSDLAGIKRRHRPPAGGTRAFDYHLGMASGANHDEPVAFCRRRPGSLGRSCLPRHLNSRTRPRARSGPVVCCYL